MNTFLKVLLVLVIPALLLGFSAFEHSLLYKRFLGSFQVETVLKSKFLTQYGEPGQLVLERKSNPDEFHAILQLIRSNTSVKLPSGEPYWISRLALENATFVTLPKGRKVVLIPESTPLFVIFCKNLSLDCREDDLVMVGTIGDLRNWSEARESFVRLGVDVVASLISIAIGLLVEFHERGSGNQK